MKTETKKTNKENSDACRIKQTQLRNHYVCNNQRRRGLKNEAKSCNFSTNTKNLWQNSDRQLQIYEYNNKTNKYRVLLMWRGSWSCCLWRPRRTVARSARCTSDQSLVPALHRAAMTAGTTHCQRTLSCQPSPPSADSTAATAQCAASTTDSDTTKLRQRPRFLPRSAKKCQVNSAT